MNNGKDPIARLTDQVYMSELMSVQASTMALQNRVDAVRNEDIIRNTAIGATYSKWLANPALSSQYKEMLDSMIKAEPNEYVCPIGKNRNKDEPDYSSVGSALTMVQNNQAFYQETLRSDDDEE